MRKPNKPGAGGVTTVHTSLIDNDIAVRIRSRREELGLHMGELANLVGISRHQLLRYELARNRVPASTLMIFAIVMGVPIGYFFKEDIYRAKLTNLTATLLKLGT